MFILCRKCISRRRRREEWYNRPWSGSWKKTRWNVPQNISGCHDDHMQCIGTQPACFSFRIHKYLYYNTTYGFSYSLFCYFAWNGGRIDLSCSRMSVSWINTRYVCRLSHSRLQCVSETCKGFILTESDCLLIYNWNITLGPRFQINSRILCLFCTFFETQQTSWVCGKASEFCQGGQLKFWLAPSFSSDK